jgi:hypothetical protein
MKRKFRGYPEQVFEAGADVVVKSISRGDLDKFLPHRGGIGKFIGTEVEWFADGVGNIIGTLAEGTTNMNWGYVVLRRDETGKYRFWDLKTRIEGRDAARVQIVRAMEATQKSGQNCSPVVG